MSPQTQATLESLAQRLLSLETKLDNEILMREGRMNGIDVTLKTLSDQVATLQAFLERQQNTE